MHPVNSRYFGPEDNKISVLFHNGISVVQGYIVKQMGTTRFRVSDGFIMRDIDLVKNLLDIEDIIEGQGTIAINTTTGPAYVARIGAETLRTTDGRKLNWSRETVGPDSAAIIPWTNGIAGIVSVPVTVSIAATGIVTKVATITSSVRVQSSVSGRVGRTGSINASFSIGSTSSGRGGRSGTIVKSITIMGSSTGRSVRTGSAIIPFSITLSSTGSASAYSPKFGSVNINFAIAGTSSGRGGRSGSITRPVGIISTISANPIRTVSGTATVMVTGTISGRTSRTGSINGSMTISGSANGAFLSNKTGTISSNVSITPVISGQNGVVANTERESNGTVTVNAFPSTWSPMTTRESNGTITVT